MQKLFLCQSYADLTFSPSASDSIFLTEIVTSSITKLLIFVASDGLLSASPFAQKSTLLFSVFATSLSFTATFSSSTTYFEVIELVYQDQRRCFLT